MILIKSKKYHQAFYFLEYSAALEVFQNRNFRDNPVWKSGNIMEYRIFCTSQECSGTYFKTKLLHSKSNQPLTA